MQRMLGWICKLTFAVVLAVSPVYGETVTVFAASSLRDALSDIGQDFQADSGTTITLVFAASSSIARQVVQGAPADVALLADHAWADWVVEQGAVDEMAPFAGNRLVLIAQSGERWSDLNGLSDALGNGNLAMAQVDAVPAGRYGKAALVFLGVWDDIAPHVVQAANVRAALRFVERGEAAFAIGYASDLVALPELKEVYGFDDTTHPPIQYVGGSVTPSGANFMAYVQSHAGQDVLLRWGFIPVADAQ